MGTSADLLRVDNVQRVDYCSNKQITFCDLFIFSKHIHIILISIIGFTVCIYNLILGDFI